MLHAKHPMHNAKRFVQKDKRARRRLFRIMLLYLAVEGIQCLIHRLLEGFSYLLGEEFVADTAHADGCLFVEVGLALDDG